MVAYLFYAKDSPMERPVGHLLDELGQLHINTHLVEADSRAGANLAELYDIMQRPAVVIATDDGAVIQQWQGELPSPEDISYAMHA